jgi:hypothetical protein
MFKKACKSHTDFVIVSKEAEVRKPGGVEAGHLAVSVVTYEV